MKLFESGAIEEGRGNDFKVWQSGFHPKAIYDENFGNQKIEYIHHNPVKKGYVLRPEHWYYSSAGYYYGLYNIPLEVDDIFDLNE